MAAHPRRLRANGGGEVSELTKEQRIDIAMLRDLAKARGLAEHRAAFERIAAALNAQQQAEPVVPQAVRNAIMNCDLYSVLTDVQNGIDSPALRSMANNAIRRIDKARDALNAAPQPQPQAGTQASAEDVALVDGFASWHMAPERLAAWQRIRADCERMGVK